MDRAETRDEVAEALASRRARDGSDTFAVNAPSDDWVRHARERALLVARDPAGADLLVIGVASVFVRTVQKYQGTAELSVGPWHLFTQDLRVEELIDHLDAALKRHARLVFEGGESRALPPRTASSVRTALRLLVPNYDEALSSLPERHTPERRRWQPHNLPLIDAEQTALRLFSRNWRTLEPQELQAPTPAALQLEILAHASENDYITDDATHFLDWETAGFATAGWFQFTKGDRKLLIKNINVSSAETKTGADLVYVCKDPDVAVLVQYKLLERLSRSRESIFRPDGRLKGQVQRMMGFNNESSTDDGTPESLRLGVDVGFVKFIDPQDSRAVSALALRTEGSYHPASLADRMLAHPEEGPSGGLIHRVAGWRALDSSTFASLVRDRWVGTRADASDRIFEVLGLTRARDPLVLALEQPL